MSRLPTLRATYRGQTFTRTTHHAYTHVVVGMGMVDGKSTLVAYSWHRSLRNAERAQVRYGSRSLYPIVPVECV